MVQADRLCPGVDTRQPPGAALHSSYETGELWQCFSLTIMTAP